MNGKQARKIRKDCLFFSDKETTYNFKEVQPGRKTIHKRMNAFRIGLVNDPSKIGVPSLLVTLSENCHRYYYKIFKNKYKENL